MSTNESIITVNELPVRVVRKRIKNIHLAVYPPDGSVKVSVPESIDDEGVKDAVLSKFDWIKRQIKSFEDQPRQSMCDFITGESHYYLGCKYLLDIVYTSERPFVEICGRKTLVLNINRATSFEECKQLLKEWYRKQMKRILPGVVRKWEAKTGLQVEFFGIKRMKTKWGSCNPIHKRIWLNLELIKKPINCLEYVVVHGMVNFLERTHNDKFLFYMDRIMPNWQAARDQLRQPPLVHKHWLW